MRSGTTLGEILMREPPEPVGTARPKGARDPLPLLNKEGSGEVMEPPGTMSVPLVPKTHTPLRVWVWVPVGREPEDEPSGGERFTGSRDPHRRDQRRPSISVRPPEAGRSIGPSGMASASRMSRRRNRRLLPVRSMVGRRPGSVLLCSMSRPDGVQVVPRAARRRGGRLGRYPRRPPATDPTRPATARRLRRGRDRPVRRPRPLPRLRRVTNDVAPGRGYRVDRDSGRQLRTPGQPSRHPYRI